MSIVAAPLHRPAAYPQVTGYSCPVDGAPVVLDQWTQTDADHEGEPREDTGLGFYCTNKSCRHSTEHIEEEDMDDSFEERREKIKNDIVSKFDIPPYTTNQ